MSKTVAVVGSMNMDLVVRSDEIPKIGETLLGEELLHIPGGKGANQGVAMAKLGNKVNFLGKVGDDSYGKLLLESMSKAGVETKYIEKADSSTGIAVINVDCKGNNNIVVIPGANWKVDQDYLNRQIQVFKESDILVFQLEIPLETVEAGLIIAKKLGKKTILNPAPARDLTDSILENVDIIIPNEHELQRMAKIEIVDDQSLLKAANLIMEKGIEEVIVTLGSRGVLYVNREGYEFFDAYKVEVVDSTAAGDSFIGGFVSSYIENQDIKKAVDIGQRSAALAVQKFGAQSSLPTREEVEAFIKGGN